MKQSSAVFLINSKGKVLLIHPSGRYNRKAPWGPPKEGLESGETPLAAAQRALSEEVGLVAGSHGPVSDLGPVTYKSKSKKVWCFTARYLGKDNDVNLDWENDQYGWFTLEEAVSVTKEEFAPILSRSFTLE